MSTPSSNSLTTISEATTPLTDITDTHTVAQVTAALTEMSIEPATPDTEPTTSEADTDSDSSVPDLVPADSVNGNSDQVQHPHPTIPIDPRAVNGTINATHLMAVNPHQHPGSSAVGYHGGYRAMGQRGVHTMDPSSTANWRGPTYLAQRALREALGDRANHPGFIQAHFRRGGAPYQPYGARPLTIELVTDLIMRLQRLEHALQGFMANTEQPWFHGHHY
ncbi:hypothetical protein C8R43DRAFT_1232153 [Mycena crocata]|nr:hypothetical protein C8R43DRAFT_1232153 [Mycena crocata]